MSKKPKLTPWFPGDVKPARPGVYRTDAGSHTYQHWDGRKWGFFSPNVGGANANRGATSRVQSPRWRGLAEQP